MINTKPRLIMTPHLIKSTLTKPPLIFLIAGILLLILSVIADAEAIITNNHWWKYGLVILFISMFGFFLIRTTNKAHSLVIVVLACILHFAAYKVTFLMPGMEANSKVSIAFWTGFYPLFVVLGVFAMRFVYVGIIISTVSLFFLGFYIVSTFNPDQLGGVSPYHDQVEGNCKIIIRDDVGYMLNANCNRVITRKFVDGNVQKIHISTDEYARRRVGLMNSNEGGTAILAIGGSRTWGDGVSDNESYPHWLSETFNRAVYVYAFSGWSPAQTVGIFSRKNFWETEINTDNLILVYLAIPGHIGRVSGSFKHVMQYHANYPKFNVSSVPAKYVGTLGQSSYWKFLAFPAINKIFGKRNQYFYHLGRSRRDYLEHLTYIAQNVAKNHQRYELYLVLHPGEFGKTMLDLLDVESLGKTGFTVIDASDLFELDSLMAIDPKYDTHLSPHANKILGTYIAEEVKKRSSLLQ